MENLRLKVAQGGVKEAGKKSEPETIGPFTLIADAVADADPKILRSLMDQVRDKHKDHTVVLLTSVTNGRVAMCVGLTKDLVGTLDAGRIIKQIAPLVGGAGGGKADFAQAGGSNPDGIAEAISKVRTLLKEFR